MLPFDGQIVDLAFGDGERVRAHIVSIDPDVRDNHVAYRLLEVLEPGPAKGRAPRLGAYLACSADDIVSLTPTDGARHGKVKLHGVHERPWWKFW